MRRPQGRPGVLDDDLALELVERGHEMQEEPPLGGASIDILRQCPEIDTPLLKHMNGPDNLPERTSQPREFPDHERLTLAQVGERRLELGTVPACP